MHPKNDTIRERTAKLLPVRRAIAKGWIARGDNNFRANRHFYFDGPVPFQVHWYGNPAHPSYTVNHESTDNSGRAIEWLEAASPVPSLGQPTT